VQEIDVHREFEKLVVTLLVIRAFSNYVGASRVCADFRDPTAVFRIITFFKFATVLEQLFAVMKVQWLFDFRTRQLFCQAPDESS
jgi:hypothetical protein